MNLRDKFLYYLPAFPNKPMSEEDVDEFLGTVIESYIEEAQFYNRELLDILVRNKKYKKGMTKEYKIETIRELILK